MLQRVARLTEGRCILAAAHCVRMVVRERWEPAPAPAMVCRCSGEAGGGEWVGGSMR